MREIPSAASLRSRIDRAIGLRDGLRARLADTRETVKRLQGEETLLDLVANVFRKLIDEEVNIGVRAVEKLQTEGLQAVFDDMDLKVRSVVEVQRGKVAVDLVTVQRDALGNEIEGVSNDAFGGSVSTVESVLLRIIIILRRNLRPFVGLDEALPAFDSHYVTNMGRFLSVLCKRLKMDVLCVTHNPLLADAADKRYRVVRRNGAACVEGV